MNFLHENDCNEKESCSVEGNNDKIPQKNTTEN